MSLWAQQQDEKAEEESVQDKYGWLFIVLLENVQYRIFSVWPVNSPEVSLKGTTPAAEAAGQSHALLSASSEFLTRVAGHAAQYKGSFLMRINVMNGRKCALVLQKCTQLK